MGTTAFIPDLRRNESGELKQWVIETGPNGKIEHGPMESWGDAKRLIARRRAELIACQQQAANGKIQSEGTSQVDSRAHRAGRDRSRS